MKLDDVRPLSDDDLARKRAVTDDDKLAMAASNYVDFGGRVYDAEERPKFGGPSVVDHDIQVESEDQGTWEWKLPTVDKDPQAVAERVSDRLVTTLINNPEIMRGLVEAWQAQMPAANITDAEYREMAVLFPLALEGDYYAISRIAGIRAKAQTQTTRNKRRDDRMAVSLGNAG